MAVDRDDYAAAAHHADDGRAGNRGDTAQEECAAIPGSASPGALRRRLVRPGHAPGPYATEGPTIQRLHAWILDHGYEYRGAGKHHEIYLGDPRRTAPEKLKTVIRQPMRPRDA